MPIFDDGSLSMDICHAHNLTKPKVDDKPFGIRVTLPSDDTFTAVLGDDWETHHWFASRGERDAALERMRAEHVYSRRGDQPTTLFEPVDKP